VAQRLGTAALNALAAAGRFSVAPGLSESEFDRIENEFGFTFSDDHRAFLAAGLPLNAKGQGRSSWPDWRDGDRDRLRSRLAWPVDGTLFDVEHNTYWCETWGPRTADIAEGVVIARDHLANAPVMVPVYSHRYLPSGRGTFGHPVLSMYQTDIIEYGDNLLDYVAREFGVPIPTAPTASYSGPRVDFWSDLVS
jgi:hypothetical protein